MLATISKEAEGKLWPHQAGALNFAINHLNKLESPCLIRMPTGTGKTGIIACLTRLANEGSSLVLTPWAHLRKQMVADVEDNFWNKIKFIPNKLDVVPMFPSTAKELIETDKSVVIVATFATLNQLRLSDKQIYEALAETISLVIVDEGHYEPAVQWGKSVKGLNTKTVLLTATPYRNDLKLFRITDPKRSTHHFTHNEAVEKAVIRDLSFDRIIAPVDIPSLAITFAKKWRSIKRSNILPSPTPRAIICCSSASDIEEAVTHLRNTGLIAIGVHEQFQNSREDYLLKDVPDPKNTRAEIWVHQHKLTEGLDDHRFCCIAIFTQIRNDRKLVQQVGRILRRDTSDRERPALLLAPEEFAAEAEWRAYLEFETQLDLLEPQHFRKVVERLLDTQPKVEYFEGRFRRQFNPTELSKEAQVIIPPSVLVRKIRKDFILDDYIEDCTDTLNTEDAVILGPNLNAPCQKESERFAFWVYASVRNSRFLQSTSLYEIKLETHCVVVADRFAFITDSRGNYPLEYIEENTVGLTPDLLARYIDKDFRPTNVSIDSSIPYDTVLRGADLRGHNLLSVAASLTDRVQICRSARGSAKDFGRRYVGMNNGRLRQELSEEDRRNFDLNRFVSWAESLARILNSETKSCPLFQRYMPICSPPKNPVPKIICLDMLRLDLSLTLANGKECRFKKATSDITEKVGEKRNLYFCTFELEGKDIDTESISLQIDYHPTKQRFWFNKRDGASVRVGLDGSDPSSRKSLAEFLNQRQDIILISLSGGQIVYQGRNFYKIDYSYAEKVLLDLIERPETAPACRTEKGSQDEIRAAKRDQVTTFPESSLFRAVADQLFRLPFRDTILICDDPGTECADFVAANIERHQLALIHAKAGSGRKISASAFHDVVAQAMKNLVYLTRNTEVPKKVNSWRRNSKWNKTNIPRLYRIPADLPTCKSLWNRLKTDIIMSSDPELYVILLTTGCCELNELKQAIDDPTKRTHEVAQLLHLLDGINGYARQLGVKLIVYDLPYEPTDRDHARTSRRDS